MTRREGERHRRHSFTLHNFLFLLAFLKICDVVTREVHVLRCWLRAAIGQGR